MQPSQEAGKNEHAPLASLDDWEDFVVARYPVEGQPADPSKDRDAYRNYDTPARDTVREFYRLNHQHQTYDFVLAKKRRVLEVRPAADEPVGGA